MKQRGKEWVKHWQCDDSVQNLEKKLWKNEELKKLEEALPRLKECELEKALRAPGVGCRSTAMIGTQLMAEMEELSRQSWEFCWRWRGSNTKQEKNNREQ